MRVWHLFYFVEAILMWRWLRQADVRHLHVHFANAGSMVGLLYARFAEAEGAGFSFTMHGPTEFDEVERFRLREKVATAAFVACISDYARSQLMRVSSPDDWDRLEIVHCGVDTDRWTLSRPASEDSGSIRILTVARLAPDKGLALLIEAVARVLRNGADLTLEIIGEGPERPALEALVSRLDLDGRVRLVGPVGQDRIIDHYAEADVFCLSSFAEGVPVVLMEAMALERPVIAPRVMGIPELVEDGVSGLLFPAGNVGALGATIARLAGEAPDVRAAMGAAGRKQVRTHFEIEESARRLASLFNAMA
jgi:glycosyltransferase involved in cell wall biosynthesis